jgi:hypothetical protein
MTSTRLWDRAGALPVPADGERPRPAVAALPASGLPTVAELFTFMRDAELRFGTLRLRIEERVAATSVEQLEVVEVTLRHPDRARVVTNRLGDGPSHDFELWISDGETVRTYASRHRLGTKRPVRRRIVGLDDPDLPGFAQVYTPLTALPMETLPEAFVHPAGFCQNVLATGRCAVTGTDVIAGREAVVLACERPRATERFAERPDFRIEIAADRDTGVIVRLVEAVGETVTRLAEVTALEPDAPLPPTAFEFSFPSDTTFIY